MVGRPFATSYPPHIVRSVTVAVTCTRDTIIKDFCGEPDEEQMHRCTQIMARSMAGALAVSLCREPLKTLLLSDDIYELMISAGLKEGIAEQASRVGRQQS